MAKRPDKALIDQVANILRAAGFTESQFIEGNCIKTGFRIEQLPYSRQIRVFIGTPKEPFTHWESFSTLVNNYCTALRRAGYNAIVDLNSVYLFI